MKRKILISCIVSLAFLYLALRGISWAEFAAVLKKTRYPYLLLAVFFTLLGHYLRAYRWRFMLSPIKFIGTRSLFSATAIGFMATNLLPARLGEVVRAYAIGRSESISKSAAFATVVYERIVDVFVILMLLWLILFRISGPSWLQKAGFSVLAVNVICLLALFLIERKRESVSVFVVKIVGKLPHRFGQQITGSVDQFFDGLKVIREGKAILPIAVVSLLVWYAALLGLYFCFHSLEMNLSHLAAATLVVFIAFGTMIPSAPAYLGTMQYACVVGLAIFDVGKSEALAYSMLYHATQFFPITIIGFYYLWRSHIGLSEIALKK
jgi:uncharacterized protein (TIRG00374 family)